MFIEELGKNPAFFWGMVLVIIFSICFHELAHGLVAVWLGDDTPIEEGRLTLSPFVHMGLFSLICLLVAGIAWGAMPVNENRLRGRYGVALVAIAGPATNVLLAGLALGGLGLWMRADPRASADLPQMAQNARYLLWLTGYANVLLAIFNLIPIPPLDGSNIMRSLSRSYSTMWNGLMASPGAYMQMSMVAFCAAGWFVGPMAQKLALGILQGIRGW
ncbi:MAG TPA: site-2 protease family protein [Tepidisphaeraceae bacterium]|jgi:Zn-dependent protease